ncbi:MAG TPA: helix-turn-helix domain-containing protein [Thermoanaerobaculia bacterium]|jgi:transcriptional regulator with XRE-family HTH domain|nr:helix-turn-helix domain-containing protein [Thermoanaerobaculia bacterium]
MPAKKRLPEGLGRALVVARLIRGWYQEDLAQASGVRISKISDYEREVRQPKMPTLERLAVALDFTVAELFELPSTIRRLSRRRQAAGPEPAGQGGRPWGGPALARAVMEFLIADAAEAPDRSEVSEAARALAEERRLAPVLWARLKDCPEEEWRELVRNDAAFQNAGFAELLCEESINAAGDSAQRALHFAELAVEVAERVPGEEAWRCQVQGYARPHLANAERVAGDHRSADAELERAAELWQAGAAADPGLLNEARVLHIKAALRREGHRVSEALALFDRALAIDRWGETPALLMGKAKALEWQGHFEEAVGLLRQAGAQLDAEREPRKLWVMRQLLVINLCHLGRHREAEQMIGEVRALARQLGNQLDLVRVDWLEGRVAAGLERHDEAIALLERVRRRFVDDEIAYDAALVTLELAEIHAILGHRVEVKALARESAPIFEQQGVHHEARRALELFRRAAEAERLTAELVRAVIVYLYRARQDPRLRFERSR